MSTQFGGARYIPILGAVVAILLVASLWLILTQPEPTPASGGKANQLLAANTAVLQAEDALSGDAAAFDSLEEVIERLRWLDTQSLNENEVTAIKSLIAALGSVRNGREAITMLFNSADDLDSLSTQLTDQTYALQGALTLQQQPQVTAQLERLRLIGGVLAKDVRSLAVGAGESMILTQQILDSEMALTQIVRGFQSGDPELGLQPLSAGGPVDALDAVATTASAISDKVKDVLAVADQLLVVDQARSQLSGLDVLRQPVAAPTAVRNADSGSYELAARLLIAAIVVFLGVAWMYYRSAGMRRAAAVQAEKTDRNQKAIQRLLDELDSLADGDLTVNATVTEDITGAIADSINYAIEALRELVTTLNVSAITVDGAAKQTDETAQQLTTASDSLSKQIDAASQAIAVMAASIEEVSGNAERSSDVARHSVAVAHKGGDAVRRTIEGMNTIRETIQETSKRIKRLGESSQEIGNIVELINDIADQTNILALNASIQASMAGEAGRGFAVVADEVQRLAERSANATKQIEVLVRTIQADTNEAVVSMERSTTDVVGGALLAENAGAALEEIEQVSNQIASLVQNISSSARDQAKSAEAVTHNMNELQEINSQTAAGTRQTTRSIRELAELAAQLRSAVAGFRLPDAGNPPASGSADGGGDGESEEVSGSSDDDGESEDEVHFADQQTA